MIRRSVAGAATATLLLLGATIAPATAAPAGGTPTAVAPGQGLAASARAVALQVQYPNGKISHWCVPYRDGMTGADVLAVAKPTYGTGPYAGFVLQVTGKGTVPPTADRYWAYWRSTTGKPADYAYSDAGVTSTRPPLRSVETWVWTTGADTRIPRKSFATLCPSGA